jgi:hypothetical protein
MLAIIGQKLDPNLVNDLLARQQQLKKNDSAPFYMVEIFTKEGTDDEKKREYIIRKTGMAPSIHDKGTHYSTNHRLTLELLNELSEPEDVVGITGYYTGNLSGVGATHSKSDFISKIDHASYYKTKTKIPSSTTPILENIDKLHEIRIAFQGLETLYQTSLPKVDPNLVNDLLWRLQQQEKTDSAPFYMVEIFTKKGTDDEKKREYIIRKTGMAPSIHDNGTHYVTNHRLTLELLNELSEPEDVVGITGYYTGNLSGVGATHSKSFVFSDKKSNDD